MRILCIRYCYRQRGLLQGKVTYSGAEEVHNALLALHNDYQVGAHGSSYRKYAQQQHITGMLHHDRPYRRPKTSQLWVGKNEPRLTSSSGCPPCALKDLTYVVNTYAEEEGRVVLFWTATGTNRGGLFGMAPTFKRSTFSGGLPSAHADSLHLSERACAPLSMPPALPSFRTLAPLDPLPHCSCHYRQPRTEPQARIYPCPAFPHAPHSVTNTSDRSPHLPS